MNFPHDNWASYYDYIYETTYGGIYNKLTADTLQIIRQILPAGTIADFGAGTGRLSIPLKLEGYEVIAVERSKPMADVIIEKAAAINLSLHVKNCSISEFENGKVDLALCLL